MTKHKGEIDFSKKFEIARSLLQRFGESGECIWEVANSKYLDPKDRLEFLRYATTFVQTKLAQYPGQYLRAPVDPITFLNSPRLANLTGQFFPDNERSFVEIFSGGYVETILVGGIGWGKTEIAAVGIAYSVYEVSCFRNPQEVFGLSRASDITFVVQSINLKTAMEAGFSRLTQIVKNSPYFTTVFPVNKDITSELRFPMGIKVSVLSGDTKAAIGRNVISGLIDEINYMDVVENSKMSSDGGKYDQGREIYNSIVRRRESRFMNNGSMPGMLFIASSKRYPGEFTDKKISEAKTNKRIYVCEKRVWNVKPWIYSGDTFWLYKGDMTTLPRIVDDQEEVEKFLSETPDRIMQVPVEHRNSFENDMLGACRDIAGLSTLAVAPYMVNVEKVVAGFDKVPSLLSRETCNFVDQEIEFFPKLIRNPEEPRFAHVDLAVTKDSCGIAVGHVPAFRTMDRGYEKEQLPILDYDFLLEFPPPKNGEIEFEKIRNLFYKVRELGLNLKWITFDTYQSRDSMQILGRHGFWVGATSMDTTPDAYDVLKSAFYDERVYAPKHEKALMELLRLEQDPKTGKIDHPAGFCFVGDTEILLSYGGTIKIKDMVGKYFEIMTYDGKNFCPAEAVNPRVTKHVTELVTVELDGGESFTCTPEHLILLEDGRWVQAQYLEEDDEIKSFFK